MELNDTRRCRRLSLRVNDAEHRALTESARRAGLEFSAYAREMLLNAKPPRAARKPAVETVMLTKALAQLGTIATELQQLDGPARQCLTQDGAMRPVTPRELASTLRDLVACRAYLLKALGRKPKAT